MTAVLPRVQRPVRHGRTLTVCAVLAVGTLIAFLVELTVGDYDISLIDAVRALLWYGDQTTVDVVNLLRLPRALVGLLAGAALGLSGAVFQTLARNPLASPDVLGVTAGANAAVVAGLVFGFGATLGQPSVAVAGGLVATVAVYLLAWRRGSTGSRVVLVGVGLSALGTSLTLYLISRANIYSAQQAMLWLTGSLNLREWRHVMPLAAATAVLVPALLCARRWLSTLVFNDDVARGLGVPVGLARGTLMLVGAGLAAFATAAAGPVAFVALVAPQLALRLTDRPAPPPVTSALTGALLVLTCDLAARPVDLPVGVVTGVIGAPYLLWLLTRANRRVT